MKKISLILIVFLSIISLTSAQVDIRSELPLVALQKDEQLQVYNPTDATFTTISPDSVSTTYYYSVWSPDGSMVAFLPSMYQGYSLYVYDVSSATTITLVESYTPALGFPLSWTPDNQILYVVQTGEFTAGDELQSAKAILEVYTIAPEANAEPQLLGEFLEGQGCGGGGGTLAELAYSRETGFRGDSYTLALTPYGLVHTNICFGRTLAVTDLATGEITELGAIKRASVSPDLTMVVGIRGEELIVIHLEDLSVEVLPTVAIPDQLTWQDNNTIIYASRELTGDLLAGLTTAEIARVNDILNYAPESLPEFAVTMHQITFNGDDTLIYEADAFAIGRMQWLPQSEVLLFSQIENMDRTVAGLVDGTFGIFGINGAVYRNTVNTQFYAMHIGDEAAILLVEDAERFQAQSE